MVEQRYKVYPDDPYTICDLTAIGFNPSMCELATCQTEQDASTLCDALNSAQALAARVAQLERVRDGLARELVNHPNWPVDGADMTEASDKVDALIERLEAGDACWFWVTTQG